MTSRRSVLAALACLVLGACGLPGPDSGARFPDGSTMARIEDRGVFTVGIKFDHPLFGYKDPATGRITGFDAEIARMVAKDLTGSESNIRFIETMPRNREDFLRRGVVDIVVATYSISDERRKLVDFTDPYYYSRQDVLVRSDERGIRELADLAGREVCTAAGSTSAQRLRDEVARARLLIVDTYSECMSALVDGRIDAISTDESILLGLMSQYPDTVRLVGRPFGREPYAIGVRRGDTHFRDHLDGLIRQYVNDGRWDEAFRDTIGVMSVSAKTAKPPLSASSSPTSSPSR
ncbi:glutamate ABC transporter substrate-binding protein [Streptomyces scabiei]|uniref:glutamate ABC transporter substrate-binding protein n=1 Tax=Streptomyces TaxID=1883 RepID=UPI001C26D2B6|nr:glutamate ABC transporter substrate-binding protein [Streptomyces sp. AC495_CC817]